VKIHQPSAKMEVKTANGKGQPTAVGTDANGEMIWELREMSTWQRLMLATIRLFIGSKQSLRGRPLCNAVECDIEIPPEEKFCSAHKWVIEQLENKQKEER
jgi:hypothetical protein